MAELKPGVTINDVAREAGENVDTVREILGEVPGKSYTKELQDKVFGSARRLGYDLKKLKIGKRMDLRGVVYEELIRKVSEHPDWGRDEIVQELERGLDMVKRVQRKSFPDEFAGS